MDTSQIEMSFRVIQTWLLLVVCLGGCERKSSTMLSMEDVRAENDPVQESWYVRYFVSQKTGASQTVPRIELIADYMARYEQGDSTYLLLRPDSESTSVVTAYLFDEQGDSSAVVTSLQMIYLDEVGRFEARGDVKVSTVNNKYLTSEHLIWNEDKREVRTKGFVEIRTPTERIKGYDLVADENLSTYRIGRVTGTMTVEEQ